MKTNLTRRIQWSALATCLIISFTACSEKESAPAAEAPEVEESSSKGPSLDLTALTGGDAKKLEEDAAKVAAEAEAKAAELKAQAEAKAAEVKAQAEAKAAEIAAQAQAKAAEVEAAATAKAAELQASAQAELEKAQAKAAEVKAQAEAEVEKVKAQAAELYSKYSGNLSQLTSGLDSLKGVMNGSMSSMIPANVKDAYGELSTSVSDLKGLVGSLSDFKGSDLGTIVPEIQAKFGDAKKIYNDLREQLPSNLTIPELNF
jgi:DNA repair exonuclease SbcCD ATPase subunit